MARRKHSTREEELQRALRAMGARIQRERVPDVLDTVWERTHVGKAGWFRQGKVALGLGALALGLGWLALGLDPLLEGGVVSSEVYRLVLGLGGFALGVALIAIGGGWLTCGGVGGGWPKEMALRIGKAAGGISLLAFGLSLVVRGAGLVAYEVGWLLLRAGHHPLWDILQLDRLLSGVPGSFVLMGALAGRIGLVAFGVQWLAAGGRLLQRGRPSLGLGALVFGGIWFAVVAGQYRNLVPHACLLLTGLGSLGLGVGWFTLEDATRDQRWPRPKSLQLRQGSLRTCQAWSVMVPLALLLAASGAQVSSLGSASGLVGPSANPNNVVPESMKPNNGIHDEMRRAEPSRVKLLLLTLSREKKPVFPSDSYMAQLQKKGKVVIGIKFDIPRFEFLNPATNRPEGFEVELGKLIAHRLGVKAEFLEVTEQDRVLLLQEQKVDLIISTMTINDDRLRSIDFSNVYYVTGQRLLVRKGSKITDIQSLNVEKAPVCTVNGTTSVIRAQAPSAPPRFLSRFSLCFQRLENRQVQALTSDDVILTGLLSRDPKNFQIVGDPFTVEPYGIGIKKGRPEFVAFINSWLREIKDDGTWVTLYNKWIKPVTGEDREPPDPIPFSGSSSTAATAWLR